LYLFGPPVTAPYADCELKMGKLFHDNGLPAGEGASFAWPDKEREPWL
jgi:hypothetical protein